ncbi:MAG: ArsR/SmtB family transcription factor [Alphaproteobacteria bacterium]
MPSDDQTAELAETFRLVGEPTRLRIVLICLDEAVSVGEIAERLDLSLSLVSHHLRLLRAARLLRAERRGKHVFYRAADEHIRRVLKDMTAHVGEPEEEAVEV